MCRRLIYSVSFVLVLGLVLMGVAKAADPDLAAHWKFDEGSGTTAHDATGNGNDGTFVGDPQWVPGKLGGALEFNGDDYLNCGNGPSLQIQDEITITFWFQVEAFSNSWEAFLAKSDSAYRASRSATTGNATHMGASGSSVGGGNGWFDAAIIVTDGQWHHWAGVYDGTEARIYIDGELDTASPGMGQINLSSSDLYIGENSGATGRFLHGLLDEVRIYSRALRDTEILGVMAGAGAEYPFASSPVPADGALHADTWVNLSWRAGDFAVSHDVYFGDNFDDVNAGAESAFQGNQVATFLVAGFPGFAYPDGLVPGTKYYWRIDEINDTEPNSPWKGSVWSFSVPPRTAYNPIPAEGAELVDPGVKLSWTGGFGAKLHTVYFGNNFDDVNNATGGLPQGATTYAPGPLKFAKTYYWRVDEFDAFATYKGDVWSFTTQGAVGSPNPPNGAVDVKQTPILSWNPGAYAASHQVYFGTDKDAVKNADTGSPEYKGTKDLGYESYEPGKLEWDTTYYWRIDEVNNTNPDGPWTGILWSFTTANFLIVDDFEDYDIGNNEIWWAWKDGLGYAAHGTEPAYAGNGTGSMVGDETTGSYCEETIVHGGSQSMPLYYDNSVGYSEATLTLSDTSDWTEEGVVELSLWFRGLPASVGGFTEGPAGTYTMTGSGTDIWNNADEFHYAYKTLTGAGSIVARVQSVSNTNNWAKAGVMIRETLDPGSRHVMMVVTPGQGISFQRRTATDSGSTDTTTGGISAPHWVKIERGIGNNFSAYHSADGISWQMQGTPENIQMGSNIYIGLAVTSHDAARTCEAVFSNVTTTGTVGTQWANQDIGILSNAAEPLYVAVSNAGGAPAVVVHDDPGAATIDIWTEWLIPLQAFADQGVNLANVNTLALGLGNKKNPVAGGSGTMYFDDIRLYPPAP